MSNGIPGPHPRERAPGEPTTPEFSRQEKEPRVPIRPEAEPERETGTGRREQERPPPAIEVEGGLPTTGFPLSTPTQTKDALTTEIENILEQDLGGVYQQLADPEKIVVRREGERAASLIRTLFVQVKVKAKSILNIIRRWLRLIPGINKFFLEQEAKIKTDQMMNLHDRIHRSRS